MAIYRNVQMSFWTDRKIDEDFSADERYLYLFLLTNPMTNLCGCYEIGRKQIVNMTGLDMKKVKAVMAKLERDQKVIVYSEATSELLLVNWYKYNWTDSEKFRKPLLAEIKSVKDEAFKEYLLDIYNGMDTVSIPYLYGMDTTVTVSVTDTDTVSVTDTVTGTVQQPYSEDPKVDKAIGDFLKYRKEMKKPMGDVSISRFLKRLANISLDPETQVDLINEAIERGWQTVYPPKETARSGTNPNALIDEWAKRGAV